MTFQASGRLTAQAEFFLPTADLLKILVRSLHECGECWFLSPKINQVSSVFSCNALCNSASSSLWAVTVIIL